jgi:hypothetical protein
MTVMLAGMTSHESDLKRYVLFEDGSMELCTVGEYIYGTWKWTHRTPTTRTYTITTTDRYTSEIYKTDLIISADGTAELELSSDKSYYGTWAEGIDRSRGECVPAPSSTPTPSVSSSSSDIPVTFYMDLGALYGSSDDVIRIVLEEDGTVEFCGVMMFPGKTLHAKVRGECTYGTWEQGSTDRQYDIAENELDAFCITQFDDGTAEYDFGQGIVTEGIWQDGNDRP